MPADETLPPEMALLSPGGGRAVELGCRCSILANAAFRSGGPEVRPLIDPACHLHAHHSGETPDHDGADEATHAR